MYCENNGREYAYDPLYNNPNSSQENAPYKQPPKESTYNYSYTNKKFPKCTCCGYVGEWKVEPLFRPIDWAIGIIGGIVTLGFGFGYLLVIALIRANKDRRDKICPNCKARNMWTFLD